MEHSLENAIQLKGESVALRDSKANQFTALAN